MLVSTEKSVRFSLSLENSVETKKKAPLRFLTTT